MIFIQTQTRNIYNHIKFESLHNQSQINFLKQILNCSAFSSPITYYNFRYFHFNECEIIEGTTHPL